MSWDGYLAAHTWVMVDGVWWHVEPVAQPGRGGGLTVAGHVITAHNPGGEWLDEAANAARHAELLAACGTGTATPSWGGSPDGRHLEEGVFVVGLDDEAAAAIGRRFGQDAIYLVRPGERVLLPCDGSPSRRQPVLATRASPPPAVVAGPAGQPGRT